MADDIIQKFRNKFFEEANMLLDQFEKDILELEKSPSSQELHESVFRAMHTIKGISGMYGFDYISEFTHLLENIFQSLRDGEILYTQNISEISLLAIDHIRNLLSDEKLENADIKIAHNNLLEKINTIVTTQNKPIVNQSDSKPALSGNITSWYIIINTSEKMYFRGISLVNIYSDLMELGTVKLHRIPVINADNIDSWGIMLVTDASIDDISDILMFIEDDCSIIKVSDKDILDQHKEIINLELEQGKASEPSILDLIENTGNTADTNPVPLITPEAEKGKRAAIRLKEQRISVETAKLDELMTLVSQLVTLNSQIFESIKSNNCEQQLDNVEKLDILAKKFRTNALQLRLVPLSDVALRFQRLIRDLSKTLNKQIEFVTEGTDIELDKNTIDRILEPLMHIMRNCIDHGIEEPQLRKQAGKPETGIIKLSASYSGNYIIIKIEDDGNGIDLNKIKEKAIEKGIYSKNDNPTEQDLYSVIFLPGFSTAQSLSEVSGRGVGMDIVKKRINDLRGAVSVESKLGKGTVFSIKLSQSLAITDTLLFRVDKSYFILPVAEVELCDNIDIEQIKNRKNTATIPYNDNLIPYIDLRKYLNLNGLYDENAKLIILRHDNSFLAILADTIYGEYQSVIKPLHKTYNKETIINAVSQLGNGKIAFLIDSEILSKQISTSQLIEI